jgi:hypothetical protein
VLPRTLEEPCTGSNEAKCSTAGSYEDLTQGAPRDRISVPKSWHAHNAAASLAFRTMAPGEDLGDLISSRLKLYVFSRQTRAATSGEIRQETEYASFVKQSAILFILMPDCVKGAASKLSAKISIAKETTYITQEVNMHVQSDKRSAPNEGVLVIF